jgi:cytochrome P450
MFLICLFLLITFAIVWCKITANRIKKNYSSFPSRKKNFLLGNSLDFLGKSSSQFLKTFEDLKKELGPVFHVSFSSFDNGHVLVCDTKVIETIFSSLKFKNKSADYNVFANWLGEGTFVLNGEKFHQHKKLFMSAFSVQILEKAMWIMEEKCDVLINQLLKTNGKEADVSSYMHFFTFDVICGKRLLKNDVFF